MPRKSPGGGAAGGTIAKEQTSTIEETVPEVTPEPAEENPKTYTREELHEKFLEKNFTERSLPVPEEPKPAPLYLDVAKSDDLYSAEDIDVIFQGRPFHLKQGLNKEVPPEIAYVYHLHRQARGQE